MDPVENNIDIKQIIKDFIKIDDELSEINKQTRDIRKKKTDLENIIKKFMVDKNLSKIDLGNGGNLKKTSKTKQTKKINKTNILNVLLDFLEENKASEIINNIYNDDDIEEITKIERIKKN